MTSSARAVSHVSVLALSVAGFEARRFLAGADGWDPGAPR